MLYSPEVHICVKPLFNFVNLRCDLNAMIPLQLLGAKLSAFFVGIVSYVIKELFVV
jgi:hypothetical protein